MADMLLSLSRAARLADVTRAELQRRIRRGELSTFEGQIAVQDLLRIYPNVSLDRDDTLERVERIKSDALPRERHADAILPSPEVLVSRLRSLSDVLVAKIAQLDAHVRLFDELESRLEQLIAGCDPATAARVRDTLRWLADARRETAGQAQPDASARLVAKDTFLRIMAANVKIIPSGHDFFVEGTESILDASVRAGIKLAYGCASGNCGLCKARLVGGEVSKTRDHDYVLSERERQMGYLLTCSHTAVTDLVLEASEALSVDDLPHQDIRTTLRKVERLGEGMVQIMVQTPRTQTLRFMAGQRVRLTLEDGVQAEPHVASCPCNGRNLHFFIRRTTNDPFGDALFAGRARQGQVIRVEGPIGRFVLDEDSPLPAVFVAFGDGIAPIKSLIEHAVSIDVIESFHLYWAVPAPEDQYQAHWCRAMRESLDNFLYTPLIDATPEDVIAMLASDRAPDEGTRYYLAGGHAMVTAVANGLVAMGVGRDTIRSESIDRAG